MCGSMGMGYQQSAVYTRTYCTLEFLCIDYFHASFEYPGGELNILGLKFEAIWGIFQQDKKFFISILLQGTKRFKQTFLGKFLLKYLYK
jgi:hypothetical protein